MFCCSRGASGDVRVRLPGLSHGGAVPLLGDNQVCIGQKRGPGS